jgi:GT2 family glycosyltransferase
VIRALTDFEAGSQGARPVVSVVVVNYNAWNDAARLALGLAGTPDVAAGRCEVIVVDNASEDAPPAELLESRAGVDLVLRAENDGFAAGVNAGWRAARGRWLLVLNPDIVADPDVLSRILLRIRHFESRPEGPPAIVGFHLRNEDGSPQPSVGHEPNLVRSLRGLFLPRPRRKYQSGSAVRAGAVPWVTGACLLIEAGLLQRLAGMDEDFFLYYEEVALCRSARLLGRSVEYDPSVEVTHLRPLQNRKVSPKLRVITRHSKLLYYRKHRPQHEFTSLARIVGVEARVRGLWSWLGGRDEQAAAWGTIGRMARSMRRGATIRGREVLVMAERGSTIAPPHRTRSRPTFQVD